MTEIRRITSDDAILVRWPILRAGFPRESAIFEGDDADSTVHLGGFRANQLAGVASIYRALFPAEPELKETWQLRGMATLPEVRGLGVGRVLLRACEQTAREAGGALLWCNARVHAATFYSRHGWQQVGDEFDIPTVGPHFRMFRQL
jgi:GNAT superfamily N-acetyltransferase